jgi:hypothetical protein
VCSTGLTLLSPFLCGTCHFILLHDGPDIQRVAVRDHDVRNLAGIERAQLVAQAEDLRRFSVIDPRCCNSNSRGRCYDRLCFSTEG